MTEKIRLKNGKEFDLIPMGISERNEIRCFKFVSNIPYYEILAEFEDESNLETIEHVLTDGTIGNTYADCVKYKSLTFIPDVQIDDNNVKDIYIISISTNEVERELKQTREDLKVTMSALHAILTDILPLI